MNTPEPPDPATFVLLDDPLGAPGACRLLQRPERIVECRAPVDLARCLDAIDEAVASGLHAAGFFAYELGYLLEPALAPLLPAQRSDPLLWMGLFREARVLDAAAARAWMRQRAGEAEPPAVRDLRLSLDRAEYRRAFDRVRAFIAAGDVYQINLTLDCRFAWEGDPVRLYLELRRRQAVRCGGLIAAPGFHVLSLSPELFLHLEQGRARMRPMKGTARRGATPAEDAAVRARLAADPKSQAENLMIVDLLRNDLGRLAQIGSVQVTDLFTVETFRSLHQLTSGVEAELREVADVRGLLRALFPCGSVTGAPKIRAMQIIRALEPQPRGVYTGAIGVISPGGTAVLDVAIRTLMLRPDGRGSMGIGSGIVFDSDADAEYDECLLKAEFLTRPSEPFSLIETLRWRRDDGWALLDRHLGRLAASAAWFGIACDPVAVRALLEDAAQHFAADDMRVRLLLDEDGEPGLTAEPLAPAPPVLRWARSDRPASSRDPFRYHKTTRRDLYDTELARLRAATGCDEVVFVNERGELTEGSWTNLFVRRGRHFLTPPVASGLLGGTLRAELLASRPGECVEAVLRPADLADADEVLLGNSVRGLMPALPVAG